MKYREFMFEYELDEEKSNEDLMYPPGTQLILTAAESAMTETTIKYFKEKRLT